MEHENGKYKDPITFGEIALALANDYDTLYVIDSEDDSYVEYLIEKDNKELKIQSAGDNFYSDTVINCRSLVYHEDQAQFLESFKKENIIRVLKTGRSFTLNYRLVINGEPLHYSLKTIRGTNQKVLVCVQNVDEQRKRELKAESDVRTYGHIAGALASRYEAIYYVNIDSNKYIQYSSSDEYAKLGTTRNGDDFFIDAPEDVRKYIHPEDVKRVLEELEKKSLLRHLEESGSVTLTYRQLLEDRSQYVTMNIVYPKNDKEHIVMGVLNVDAQIRREQSILEESLAFGEVARALATRYEVIYRINIITDEYTEYSASEKYTKLKVGSTGADFFEETHRNMQKDIYPEDLPMMNEAMKKDFLLNNLDKSGKILINYRLMLDGRPQYVTLLAVRCKEDTDYIIVAVENIDQAKRKELEFERAIGSAMDMANKDSLTGIKNKHSYAVFEMKLDHELSSDESVEFAIAVLDINGLKEVNDNQGHSAGDEFIKSACSIICNVFAHSPVFRIGGDEFVVILKGSDYKNRMELIAQFALKQLENKNKGLVTMAYGISDFDRSKDMRVQDVFERADTLMYENKKRFKGEAPLPVLPNKNGTDSALQFYILYEQLVSAMTDVNNVDVARIESLLCEISVMFRLSKGVTRVYRNPQEEQMGKCEELCCFDTGEQGEELISLRVVTSVMSSAVITVYMSPDEEPLSEEERWKVELVMRTTLSFISRNRLKDIVEQLAYFDDSGYPNLRSLNKYVSKNTSSFDKERKAAVRYNLLHFSLVNQQFGKELGDVIMREHFEAARSIIGDSGYLARLGGDNFVGICSLDKLKTLTGFLAEAPISLEDGSSVIISTSTGVFVFPEGYRVRTPSDFMGQIINAFRVAQVGGGDRLVFFDQELLNLKEKSMRIQHLFPIALKDGEFKPFYQPKVNIVTGKIEGAEALCRWFHADDIIPPDIFIPILEETYDICKLDLYMLEHVCRDLRRWLDEGREIVRISVNFSRRHMMNAALPEIVAEIADFYRIPHEYIEVELTETTTDVEFNDLKRIVGGLNERGFRISIDDFGIGYSSLNMIRDLPWNTIKIDKSFLPVEEDDDRSVRTIMFRTVVSMICQLGLNCIAEGVETQQQLDILRENSCEYAQGFFFDRPLPVEEFEVRLENKVYSVE